MEQIVLTSKDLVVVGTALGPTLVAAFGIWTRMARWQTTVSSSIAALQAELVRVETDRKERESEARAHADEVHRRIGHVHDKLDDLVRVTSELRGWREGVSQ